MIQPLIITGDQPRHLFFAEMIRNYFENTFLIVEQKTKPKNDFLIVKEKIYFPQSFVNIAKNYNGFIECQSGNINCPNIVNAIRKINPDIMFIFGCSLLQRSIFSIPSMGCINIHTGIVQLFRGVDSCFWAIYDEKPTGIGATIHYVDESIDAGNIIYQDRPILSINDDFSDLFLKSCKCGFNILEKNICNFISNNVNAKSIDVRGKIYATKDLTDTKLSEGKNKIQRVLSDYLNKTVG